ncbi:hypothetical protein STEG23_034758 [Scotinomys teguina]
MPEKLNVDDGNAEQGPSSSGRKGNCSDHIVLYSPGKVLPCCLQPMETITESHNWSSCREQLIVGKLSPSRYIYDATPAPKTQGTSQKTGVEKRVKGPENLL